jgi:hypothetical protein
VSETRTLTIGYGAIVTAVVGLLTYAIALHNGFAFDDVVLVPGDVRVTGAQLRALLTTPYWNDTALSLYRPLTSLSFGLDWAVAPNSPAWFHFTNLIWHCAASVLVYLLLVRYFDVVAALLGAVIFAVHPVHVEAVANIVGRAELMAATLVLAACVMWPRMANRSARALISALLYFLALGAKESAAVLPALLVMIDFADGEWTIKTLGAYLRRRAPELLALIATFAIFMIIRTAVLGSLAPTRLDPSIEVLNSGWHRVMTALQAWPLALKLLIFPWTLLADYGPRILLPIGEWNTLSVLGLTMLIALVAGGVIALVKGHRRAALGLSWYPIAILPVSNLLIPIGVLLAERTLYLPSVALSIGAAALFRFAQQRAPTHRLALVLALGVPLALSVRSMVRIPEWKSTNTIMLALVRDRPDAFRGQWHAARVERAEGRAQTALERYDVAFRLWPYRQGLVQEAASFASGQGRTGYARSIALFGAQRWPDNVNFHRIASANSLDLGDTITAIRTLRRGLLLHPNDSILNRMWQAASPENRP